MRPRQRVQRLRGIAPRTDAEVADARVAAVPDERGRLAVLPAQRLAHT
ncbi:MULTISPECIES: hypothetical protein [unclassified Streptomyces]|nr:MULTISPECIES: hypothetical protein [unclassified Streptomyces]